jgi:MFS family permease
VSGSLYTRAGWYALNPTARGLIVVRFLRSLGQGALAVDFTLYLRARGWSAAEVGGLLMVAGLVGAGLGLAIGTLSDRLGRRGFLLFYEAGLIVGTLAVMGHPAAWVIAAVAMLFGFGRGANGASGPFAPAEQAWLAQMVPADRRGSVFSFNAGVQFWGMGAGSLLAAVLIHVLPGARGPMQYMPVFGLTALVAMINGVQLWTLKEERRPAPSVHAVAAADENRINRQENRAMTLLMMVNMTNSLGVGLIAPLLPYWFNVRFGVGPDAIGPVYALTFGLTGISSVAVGHVAERLGLVRAIVLPRILGIVLLVLLPLMPHFGWAAVLYVARSIVNRGSAGARQAFSVNLVRDQRRGLASSLNAASWSVPAAVGPAIGGWLIASGSLAVPFWVAAGLQLAYLVLFPTVMGGYDMAQSRAPKAWSKPGSR